LLAVQCVKSIPAWLLLKGLGRRFPSLYTNRFALARLREVDEPRLPGPRWARVRPLLSGVCGSDLATIAAEGSPFFAPLTSFPFTFGHEVVGTVTEVGAAVQGARVGDRVVIEPVLRCAVRGIEPPCPACREGHNENCTNIMTGAISAGVQTGFCRDTGGAWSSSLVAHDVQLYKVPDTVAHEAAVLVEPFSCALHAVLRALTPGARPTSTTENVLVLGCGTIGLLTIAAIRALDAPYRVTALAKYPHQHEWARKLGADQLVSADNSARDELCKLSGATMHQPEIGNPTVLGGFDVVFDCVGSPRSLDDALRFTRARGTTVLVAMPAIPRTVDWPTPC